MKLVFDVHASVNHPNDGNRIGLHEIENQMTSDHEADKPGAKLERSRPMKGKLTRFSKFD